MSKIKIVDQNKATLDMANTLFERILSLQTEAENQVRDIRAFEKKILDIQREKQQAEEEARKREEMLRQQA